MAVNNTYVQKPDIVNQPGGGNTTVQFNQNGDFAGDSGLRYNPALKELTVQGNINVGGWVKGKIFTNQYNFFLTGGENGQVLSTDGTGNLSWTNAGTSSSGVADWGNIQNKPSFSTVAVTGSYDDLTNKPALFNGNYNSLSNKPNLFDGNYNSLTNKPTIFDGNYNSLTNKPTIFDGNYNSLTNKPTIFDGNYNSLTNKPTLFDGNYNSLSNKPTIPSIAGLASETYVNNAVGQISIPTNLSQFTNDAGFITSWGWADWNETSTESPSYIINKPIVPTDINQLSDADGILAQIGNPFDQTLNQQDSVRFGAVSTQGINFASGASISETNSDLSGRFNIVVNAESNVYIQSNESSHMWNFDNTGTVILPGNIVLPQVDKNASPAPILSGILFSDGSFQDTAFTSASQGLNGLSAYEIAVSNGFVGSETDWLASLVGPAGTNGVNGTNGVDGIDGVNGLNGTNGQDGAKGDKGDTGAQGVSVILQGTKATIADLPAQPVDWNTFAGHGWIVTTGDGSTHLDGSLWFWNLNTGEWNDIGPIVGPKGDTGAQGEKGQKGDNGTNGLDGRSAYDLAVAGGFTGTESEWLASLVGPAGQDGAPGQNGANGIDGINGTNGTNGQDGAPGVGVPTGGTSGQVLAKIDGSDYNTEWVTPSTGSSFDQSLNTTDNVTFNQVSFPGNGIYLGTPVLNQTTNGTKLLLWPEAYTDQGHSDYAIGMAESTMWLGVPTTTHKISFYGGDSELANIDGTGLYLANGLHTQNITYTNDMEIYSTVDSNGNIDLYTNAWNGGGVEVWLQHNNQVSIVTDNGAYSWNFTKTGDFQFPNFVKQTSPGYIQCPPNMDTVIYTGTSETQATFKILLKVEGPEIQGDFWETQSCEMMIAKSVKGNKVAGSVYGLVYTSNSPLATFSTRWNTNLNRVEVLCRPTSTTDLVSVRSFVTEMDSTAY